MWATGVRSRGFKFIVFISVKEKSKSANDVRGGGKCLYNYVVCLAYNFAHNSQSLGKCKKIIEKFTDKMENISKI